MKNFVLILFIHIAVGQVQAQLLYDNNWIFAFEDDTTSILNFSNETLTIQKRFQNLKLSSSNGSISDDDGNLKFYSNGCEIYSHAFSQMQNGAGLNPGSIADNNCSYGYTAGPQSLIILPSLQDSNFFHLFHKRIIVVNGNPVIAADTIFHTIVDISENNGLGKVIQKNFPINTEKPAYAFLTAAKKLNSDSWWIISAIKNSNAYEIFLLQDELVIESKIQNIGAPIEPLDEDLQTILSPKGDLYVRAFADRGIFLFDFDREFGELSNPRHIDFTIEPKFGGAAVSSNGRFLYVNSLLEIWQFDLEADEIEASKTLIATYDGYASPFASTFFQAQIGPDCKLYYNSNNGEDVLHVMHNPNVKGTACNFEQHGIQLFTSHGISLPYFPSFRLDSSFPICDTTRLVATSIQLPVRSPMQVWAIAPNPTGGRFSLATNLPLRYDAQVFIYNASGQLVLQKEMSSGEKAMELNLDGFGSGVYFYQVIGEKGVYGSGRVVKN